MNSRFIILFLIAPFISFGQITKVKSYSLNSNGIPWRADIEIMQKDSIKEAFLRIQYKDNGIYFKNFSYLSWQEVKEINEGYTEMAIGAINDKKTGKSTQTYFKTEDGTYIGYEVKLKKLTWFIYKESVGLDSIIRLDRDKLFATFKVAESRMTELLN